MGAPSYQKLIERNRLKEATQGFKSDVQVARMEAIKRSRNTFFSRAAGDDGAWCYGIGTVTCDCNEVDDTELDFCDIKRISGASFPVVSLATSGDSVFDSRRGTSTDLDSVFTTRHYAAQVQVSVAGRVVICNPIAMPLDENGVPLQGIYGACGG
ncbi:GspH/FimT family pseudopilin [Haliea sp. E1-2-M8]|nr:GspH/FimT family pseudopilin [Haliea sp. E1-2-M8]MDO8864113.1 GspH/FimT family pseudopilin [Haliea sp. E1-2-M8]